MIARRTWGCTPGAPVRVQSSVTRWLTRKTGGPYSCRSLAEIAVKWHISGSDSFGPSYGHHRGGMRLRTRARIRLAALSSLGSCLLLAFQGLCSANAAPVDAGTERTLIVTFQYQAIETAARQALVQPPGVVSVRRYLENYPLLPVSLVRASRNQAAALAADPGVVSVVPARTYTFAPQMHGKHASAASYPPDLRLIDDEAAQAAEVIPTPVTVTRRSWSVR